MKRTYLVIFTRDGQRSHIQIGIDDASSPIRSTEEVRTWFETYGHAHVDAVIPVIALEDIIDERNI